MVAFDQLTERCKASIDDTARKEGFVTFELSTKQGSSEGDNFLSDIVKVVINGVKSDGCQHTLSLVLKISLKHPKLRENSFIQTYFRREVLIYTQMLPALEECQKGLNDADKFHFAKFYDANLEEGDEFLILEDLSARGLVMLDRMKSFNYEQLVACVNNTAKLHATSIVLKTKNPVKYGELSLLSTTLEHIGGTITQFITRNVPNIKELIKTEPYSNRIGSIMDNLSEEVKPFYSHYQNDPYNVLCHGDCWTNNLFFKFTNGKINEMVFLDWQLMVKASPVFDISYVLLIGIDSEMRSKHYYEMLDLYYETLSSNVSKMGLKLEEHYPRNVYELHVKKYMSFGFILSFGVLPVTLGNKGDNDAVNMRNAGENEKNTKTLFPEKCCARMKELFEDCIKYGVISGL